MGVPITFLDKYNPAQFEIVGATESEGKGFSNGLWYEKTSVAQAMINRQKVYKRIFLYGGGEISSLLPLFSKNWIEYRSSFFDF